MARFPYAMTLRLTQKMAEDLEDVAYTLRRSRAGLIRRSLAETIVAVREAEGRESVQSRGGRQ